MSSESSEKVQTILCIPGPWKDRSDLVTAVAKANDGKFVLAGNVLFRTELNEGYDVDVCNADSRMLQAFSAAGPHWENTPEMLQISEHQMVVYIVGEGGSPERAERLMFAAIALLNAGGFGVKVESTGLAQSPDSWRELASTAYLLGKGLHGAYVIYITDPEHDYYSCGMHNLGHEDALVAAQDSEDPVELLREFTSYMVMEKPVLGEGHTFRVGPNAPRYRITHEPCTQYEEGNLYMNPFGMWRLSLLTKN